MPYVYVSEKADEFSDPVYHCDAKCRSVDLLDDNDTLVDVWIWALRPHTYIFGFKKRFRQCENCCD